MAVHGFCENKGKHEVYTKEETDNKLKSWFNGQCKHEVNCNDLTVGGQYYLGERCTNVPNNLNYCRILVLGSETSTDIIQFGIPMNKQLNQIFKRLKTNNEWEDWKQIYPEVVQTETKTYSDETGSINAIFRKSGNVVTVDMAITAKAKTMFSIIGSEVIVPNFAQYNLNGSGDTGVRGVNYVVHSEGTVKCYVVRYGSGTCILFAAFDNTFDEERTVNMSITYIVD